MSRAVPGVFVAALLLAGAARAEEKKPAPLKIGIIGLDTSHVTAFTDLINKNNEGPLENMRVVAAFPAGSPDLPISADRLAGFTKTLREKHKVEIVKSIAALLGKVDAVLLESVDGRPHLEQVRPVLEAGKPVFIDKPVAASLADAIEIFDLAKEHKVAVFSSSSLRFSDKLKGLAGDRTIGKLLSCETTGPVTPLKGHPELFFYGIHGIEMLFTVLGPGCESVKWKGDAVTGVWKDGRVGTFRIDKGYKATVIGDKGKAESDGGDYRGLVREIGAFFRTGKAPVPAEETIELVAFMTAAEQSKKAGATTVTIESVMKSARQEVAARKKKGK